MKTSTKPALMTSVLVLVLTSPASCSDLDLDVYTICSTTTNTTQLLAQPDPDSPEASVDVRSATECAQLCSGREGCGGVSVCPAEGSGQEGVVCRVVDSADTAVVLQQQQQHCPLDGNVQQGSRYACYFKLRAADALSSPLQTSSETSPPDNLASTPVDAETTSTTPEATTQLECENGGTSDGTRCWCPLPYAGRNCSRYMRDCSEGVKEQGHSGPHGTYIIQPSDSPTSFEVQCNFDGDGTTYTLRKKFPNAEDWTGHPWDESSMNGFGESNPIPANSENFFIGLEKTRQITIQAEYKMNIYMAYNNWNNNIKVFYWNFTLGPDSAGFEPSYSQYESRNTTQDSYADNMLQGDPPVKFSTYDRCYPADCSKKDGWFGANGNGFRILSYPLVWRLGGVDESLDFFQLGLVRWLDFYDD